MTQNHCGSTLFVLVTLFAAGAQTISARRGETTSSTQQASTAGSGKTVRTEVAARTQVVSREIRGSFAQHPAVLAELRRYVGVAKVPTTGPVMGIYPMDPDVVPEGELRWQVAVPVSRSIRLKVPYSLTHGSSGR